MVTSTKKYGSGFRSPQPKLQMHMRNSTPITRLTIHQLLRHYIQQQPRKKRFCFMPSMQAADSLNVHDSCVLNGVAAFQSEWGS